MTFLGIDGGGSKTAFLLENDDGEEIAQVRTGPSNWTSSDADRVRESLEQGVHSLPTLPDVVCGGFAGAGRPEAAAFYQACLRSLIPQATILVETDAVITYFGAIGPTPGVLLIAGTGSIAMSRDAHGTMRRAGGWGVMFGDEGGGFWIGKAAIAEALRAHDADASPEFVSRIAEAIGLTAITEAPAAWKRGELDVPRVASLAQVILEDPDREPGAGILRRAASCLRELTETARVRAGLPASCRKSASGSIALHPYMQSLMEMMEIRFEAALHSPARGAILLARDRIRSA